MKLLVSGDLHIGRRPSRVPPTLADDPAISAAAVWEAIVDHAIRENVDALALTGDIVDKDNRYFEAFGPLERGLNRLADVGIPTVAVAGNHDFDVLPQLADSVGTEHFHLLGNGGKWERCSLPVEGGPLHFDGWSFPAQHVRSSPIDSYNLEAPPNGVVFGVLHADLDQINSPYAPVTRRELLHTGIRGWLLGHVHQAKHLDESGATILYPGSPQGLDPSETGAHGPWLVEVDGGDVQARQTPLAPVRYDAIEVDVTSAGEPEDVRRLVAEQTIDHARNVADDGVMLACLSCRVILTGRTSLHGRIDEALKDVSELECTFGETRVVVESVRRMTRPAVDVDALARGGEGVVSRLARLLVDLEGGGETNADLVRNALERVSRVRSERWYDDVDAGRKVVETPDEQQARAMLVEQGFRLLESFVDQKEGTA